MPKIYPAQHTTFPMTAAEVFGEIQTPLFLGKRYPIENNTEATEQKAGILQDLYAQLENFNPTKDHILMVGDPILIGLAIAVARDIAIDKEHDTINVLRYDKYLSGYISVTVEVG